MIKKAAPILILVLSLIHPAQTNAQDSAPDLQYYYEDTIGKYNPQLVVFYTGDNDVAGGSLQVRFLKITGRSPAVS
ncbi:MAG: hypothetical protein R3224_01675 [Balneolaceae bacterium]|nr:hypothetical protein [Balneolaceae bacterium]